MKQEAKIKIEQQKDGRWFAEYINPKDILLNGIGQFGKTSFEAEINLQALINATRKAMLKTTIDFNPCIKEKQQQWLKYL
jgi:hypothetical protein